MILKAIMRYFSLPLPYAAGVVFDRGLRHWIWQPDGGDLHLGMLPWDGDTLNDVVLFGAMFGLLTVVLAMSGILRILFLIWSFLVFVMLVKGYIFSHYTVPAARISRPPPS